MNQGSTTSPIFSDSRDVEVEDSTKPKLLPALLEALLEYLKHPKNAKRFVAHT